MSSGGHPSTGGARAFAQKLSKSNAHDIRLQTAAELKNEANTDAETGGTGHAGIANALARRIGRSSVSSSSSATLSPSGINNLLHPSSASRPSSAGFYLGDSAVPVEPLDYEEYVSAQRHRCGGSGGQDNTFLDRLVDFPVDDIEVNVVPRKIRTLGHVVPEEPLDKLDPSVQNCVEAYTSDWVVVTRRYHHYSSSVRKRQQLQDIFAAESASSTLKHEFELDEAPEYSPTSDTERVKNGGIGGGFGSSGSQQGTPRGSWASFDLRNSHPDALIPKLLEPFDADVVDKFNENNRSDRRPPKVFSLYPIQPECEIVERRLPAVEPAENLNHRLLVQCNKLELNLQIEPIFASMALYDAKEKKKVSENFYFDMNPEQMRKMLGEHVENVDYSTQARACVFDISQANTDLFLVVKLEKVLQGDINKDAEPYLKDTNMEKARANAYDACNRLGRYRMPFAWTAIWLQNIIKSKETIEKVDSGSDADSTASNSLDRKTSTASFDQYRKKASTQWNSASGGDSGSLSRKGSFDRKRSSWAASSGAGGDSANNVIGGGDAEAGSLLDSFPPVTLTVSSFFKQEIDKLKDDDLFKFLQDLKRPSPVLKRLKCIRGTLKLDISVAPEQIKHCYTPELCQLIPFPNYNARPTKEILEFSHHRENLLPCYQFRNLLYVCPKDLNFTNRSGERARNIAVKVQFMEDGDKMEGKKVIFGKSLCPEFIQEAYSAVTYHNKTPDFYEEIKIKLPSNLREYHHLLFTFYHISCQGQRKDQASIECPVGYSWIPIFQNGSLQTGLYELPVMLDPPPTEMRYVPSDSAPPGTKWVDNKKPIFSVELIPATTVHPLDPYIDPFLNLTATLQLGQDPISSFQEKTGVEDGLLKRINDLSQARLEPMVRFLPLVLDKLLLLMVKPPSFAGHVLNVGQAAFMAMAAIVNKITGCPDLQSRNDRHGRNELLTTYIHYQAHLPHPDLRPSAADKTTRKKEGANGCGAVFLDEHVERFFAASERAFTGNNSKCGFVPRLVHEQMVFQWTSIQNGSSGSDTLISSAAWFFLEITIKAMIEHLATTSRLGVQRKCRFSEQFHEDTVNLVSAITQDIICRRETHPKVAGSLNSSLAFFLHDLLSVMDRGFVFSLIRTYVKDTATKAAPMSADSFHLWLLQIDFARIVCSHEHFVALNLPTSNPSSVTGVTATDNLVISSGGGGTSSPTPSVRSTDSQSSFVDKSSSTHWAELTADFRRKHFLVGLVLSQLANAFDHVSPQVHYMAVNNVRNLLTSHDIDNRFSEVAPLRSRVANLYLPLIAIILDNLPKLYAWSTEGEARIVGSNQNEQLNIILNVISDNLPNTKGPIILKENTTRHLLVCFLWVLKNVDKSVLKQWWVELSHNRLQTLLEVLRITLSCFQYKGKRPIRRHQALGMRKTSEMRSRLEDMILGQGSNRQEMLQRPKRDRLPPSPNLEGNRRWHKTSLLRNNTNTHSDTVSLCSATGLESHGGFGQHRSVDGVNEETEVNSHLEGNLATEASMTVLDTLELIVQVVSHTDHSQGLLTSVLRVLLHALAVPQSTYFIQHLFAVQRSFVFKFPSLLFDEASEHCADLCLRLLRHCSSSLASVRSQASASLYLLMRQNFEIGNNFARVKMQVTMSLSFLVGTVQNFNEDHLRKSLKTILVYAEKDNELSDTSFPEQVQDLVFNLHMILSDTVKMKEYHDDPEMHMDLMYRIAKGYQNSPDLRLTWLESMATKHEQQEHYSEAAMCKVHCAALISEYLHMLEDRKYMPTGAVTFAHITPNALEESAVSEDVVSPDEEGICTGKYFTESGLVGFVDEAARLLHKAGMFETVNEVYKAAIPIAEAHRNFTKLAQIHEDLHEAFKSIHKLQGKRIFGTYFRVGFYGSKFGDLDGEEYVYKEKALAKLPEIAHRIEHFYSEKFGKDNLIIIKDSKFVETDKLNPDKAYIQITYVEPHFDSYELRDRVTTFEKNFNIMHFIFSTPFTPDGHPHGELHEQFKRKTILTTSHHFPYVKTRIQIVDRKEIVLTPIEVAIEDVEKKISELEAATKQNPPDPKILQMVLQGCIGTTVNQGPIEVANVFLKDLVDDGSTISSPTPHQNKLRLCFKDFSNKCEDALKKNKKLISHDQKEYQQELEKNYRRFEERLSPIFVLGKRHQEHDRNSSSSSSSSSSLPKKNQDINSKVTSPMI